VLGFTRALAQEVGKSRVRVNAIVPGYITTDMTKGKQAFEDHLGVSYSACSGCSYIYTDLEKSKDLLDEIPAGRFGTPEEVADAALFLVRNQYANNCVINLDGGLSAT
jgi:3-oxoacyl-[acyl-carrier protein] reductase